MLHIRPIVCDFVPRLAERRALGLHRTIGVVEDSSSMTPGSVEQFWRNTRQGRRQVHCLVCFHYNKNLIHNQPKFSCSQCMFLFETSSRRPFHILHINIFQKCLLKDMNFVLLHFCHLKIETIFVISNA